MIRNSRNVQPQKHAYLIHTYSEKAFEDTGIASMRGLSHEIALSVLFTYTEIWLFIICWIVFKLPCLHAFLNSSTRRRLEFKIINTILTQTTHLCMLTYLPWSRYWSYTYSFNSRLKLNSGTMWSKDIYVKLNSPFFFFYDCAF